ncbi:MAG TPA: SDR family oxidoreductase [Steroidobacteraceae bacterium]|nr:SDR family oxidoreductase [Steroidobacteraceae bacterium]
MDLKLAGKRVLVTGGNSGLGAAMVRAFAAEGARVAINYLVNPDATAQLITELQATGAVVLGLQADIAQADAVAGIFDQLDKAWGGIDILVSNAGIDGPHALAWEADATAWNRVIQINLVGAFLCAREALRRMVPQKSGVILHTSSVHEQIAWSGYSAYSASKAAVSMMAKTLAQEAGPFGVRVLCIAPGAIRTPINASVWQDPEGARDLLSKIALGRVGEPQDIAGLAVVLCSEVAGYVTGTSVFVDGGMTDYPAFMHGG